MQLSNCFVQNLKYSNEFDGADLVPSAEVLVQNKSIPTEFVGVQDTFGHSASPAELLNIFRAKNIAEKAKKAISRK